LNSGDRLDAVSAGSQNQRSVKTILLAAAALAALIGCQGNVERPHPDAAAQSGDLANCARIRVVPGSCGKNAGFAEVYIDNMHKHHMVRATIRKHSPEGDEDTDYAIAEGGHRFIDCVGGSVSFAVVGCKVLKNESEQER